MNRFFIEVAYLGTAYAGFQKQQNANTIQAEIEKALEVFFRKNVELTGSSRTDAGVHARQNYFHTDTDVDEMEFQKAIYHINAILPDDIVMLSVKQVNADAHCRFDAVSRTYQYTLYLNKDPFMKDRGFFYPYHVDVELLNAAASIIKSASDFEVFAKKNSQVHTFICKILKSEWKFNDDHLIYEVEGNRFLRGMVRGLTGTMLKVGRKKMSVQEFEQLFISKISSKIDFSVPARGLTLERVKF